MLVVGADWSAVMPYYAGRRAVMMPEMLTLPEVRTALADLPVLLGGTPLASVVLCPSLHSVDPWIGFAVSRITAPMRERRPVAGCRIFTY